MVRMGLAILFLVLSCSTKRQDGQDAEDSSMDESLDLPEIVDADAEPGDVLSDELDSMEDPPADVDQDAEGLECIVPIRDCGTGCRQVTCASIIWESWSWDVADSRIAYFATSWTHGTGLFYVDLFSGKEEKYLDYPDSSYDCKYLSAFNNLISYEVYKIGTSETCKQALYIYNVAENTNETAVCYEGETFEDRGTIKYVDMYGDRVVWDGKGVGDLLDATDLFYFDLALWEMHRVTTRADCWKPRIWESRVVCMGLRDSVDRSGDVILWDLDTETPRNITNYPMDQINAEIWQSRVVWVDHGRAEDCTDIYWCDLPECVARPATTNWACQDHPDVEGDWIVWQDFRNDKNPLGLGSTDHDNIEIWGYNISTDREYQIGSFNEIPGSKLKIYNGKCYFVMEAIPGSSPAESNSIFEIDLSQFL